MARRGASCVGRQPIYETRQKNRGAAFDFGGGSFDRLRCVLCSKGAQRMECCVSSNMI